MQATVDASQAQIEITKEGRETKPKSNDAGKTGEEGGSGSKVDAPGVGCIVFLCERRRSGAMVEEQLRDLVEFLGNLQNGTDITPRREPIKYGASVE